MTKTQYITTIQKYFQDKPVLKAYLFGSILGDSFTDKSDIDILVELDYHRGGSDFYMYLQMQEELGNITKRKVDLVSANGLSLFLKPLIDSKKELVYERKG